MAEKLSELRFRAANLEKAFRGDAFALVADGEVSEEALATFEQRVDELMLELSDFAADVRNYANAVGVVKTEEGNHE